MRRSATRGAEILLAAFLVMGLGAGGAEGQSAPGAGAAARFVGTWRLVSIEANGRPDPNRGAHPTGLIYYDGAGNMAVQIMPDRARPRYAGAQPTADEAGAALIGYTAYFGRYSVDERARTVTHHRQGSLNPGQVGGDAVRRYEFAAGDRLVLTPLENPTTHLTWERIR